MEVVFPQQKLEGGTVYYITPLNSCEPCVKMNLEMLTSISPSNKIKIVFVGEAQEQEISDLAQQVKMLHADHYLADKQEKIHSYPTGFGKPILIHLSSAKSVQHYIEVINPKVEQAREYLKHFESL